MNGNKKESLPSKWGSIGLKWSSDTIYREILIVER